MPVKKSAAERPTIEQITPVAAIPGGDCQIRGKGFGSLPRPVVAIGGVEAPLVVGSDNFVVARVPDGAWEGGLQVVANGVPSDPSPFLVAVPMADSLHPVANPAVDAEGNTYTTFSGSRGQKTPVAIYRIDREGGVTPYLPDLMNATSLAFGPDGVLYVSSRFDGAVYQVTGAGTLAVYVEGMGVATGLAFDTQGDLYVGDRSGTVFKISRERQIYVYATLEPSIAAYHLAFDDDGYLYVSGPTTSSFDAVHRISPGGEVEVFYRGLGRPQGLAFDGAGNLYVASSLGGRKGIVRINREREAELFLSGPNIVGLAFTPWREMMITTTGALYRLPAEIAGRPLP
jgi:sugar lactone lactonase YvrE